MDSDKTLISLLVALEVPHAFSAFMPSYFTISKFAVDPADAGRLRAGYAPAAIYGAIVGAVVSVLIKDWTPFLFCLTVIVVMLFLYEGAISKQEARNAG